MTMESANTFCTECGSPLAPQSRFCQSCGSPVASQQSSPMPSTPPVPPAPPPTWNGQPTGSYPQQGAPASPVPTPYPPQQGPPGYGQQPSGPYPYRQSAAPQPPPGYAPQNTYPAGYGGGSYQPSGAGPLGVKRESSRGGCLKVFLILLVLLVVGGGALWYFDSQGTITLPWSDQPDPKLYIGRWQAVNLTTNGKTADLTKEKDKYLLELVQVAKPNLTGKMTNTAFPKSVGVLDLKPSKDGKRFEGTATDSMNPKEIVQITLEYEATGKELIMTAVVPRETPSTMRLRKQ